MHDHKKSAKRTRTRPGARKVAPASCSTGKKPFATKVAAQGRLRYIKARNKVLKEQGRKDEVRPERRAYRCEECGGWHLTSQVQRSGRPTPKTSRRVRPVKRGRFASESDA